MEMFVNYTGYLLLAMTAA